MGIGKKLNRSLKRLLLRMGYDLRPVSEGYDRSQGYVLYRFTRPDGSFDLDSYRKIQEEGNKNKLENVWVIEENIAFLADYLKRHIGNPVRGICHGTRRGMEQEWFRKYIPGCDVIGTEISETATRFPYTIQWDFHNVKEEWIDAFDFIYSNSFDHTYDPERCLNAWLSCLRQNGVCIIEHSSKHGPSKASQLDPFGAELVQMPYLIALWGKGRYCVREILNAPKTQNGVESTHYLAIHKFS
ncbi:MAG: class I SAM-dependent methyltransferase [Deltaproteobacteria bacterium]|nr:class I SAM-dependent methyltransferase [Deltaproteobacteria bacterium]MDH3382541.1 class I SAM-dependent methyltransferase [Deltaproteobacteria bacterium]